MVWPDWNPSPLKKKQLWRRHQKSSMRYRSPRRRPQRRSLEALSCAIEGLVVPRWRTESGLECRHLVVMRGGLYSASVGFVFSDEARSRGHKRERAQLRAAIAALFKRYPAGVLPRLRDFQL
jgi:hypothetical protein